MRGITERRETGGRWKRAREYKYLSMTFTEGRLEKAKQEKETKALQSRGRLGSAAKRRASKYEIVRELWKVMAVPSVMYRVEATM